jgi:hypothetical protein
LEVNLQSIIPTSLQANPKDIEGSSCENIKNIQVHFKPNITQYGSSMVLLSVFQTKLKALETNNEWVFNIESFQMSKLKEQKLVWED